MKLKSYRHNRKKLNSFNFSPGHHEAMGIMLMCANGGGLLHSTTEPTVCQPIRQLQC